MFSEKGLIFIPFPSLHPRFPVSPPINAILFFVSFVYVLLPFITFF